MNVRIERIAAGIADLNNMTLRYQPPVTTKRDPWWKIGLGVCALGSVMVVFVYGGLVL